MFSVLSAKLNYQKVCFLYLLVFSAINLFSAIEQELGDYKMDAAMIENLEKRKQSLIEKFLEDKNHTLTFEKKGTINDQILEMKKAYLNLYEGFQAFEELCTRWEDPDFKKEKNVKLVNDGLRMIKPDCAKISCDDSKGGVEAVFNKIKILPVLLKLKNMVELISELDQINCDLKLNKDLKSRYAFLCEESLSRSNLVAEWSIENNFIEMNVFRMNEIAARRLRDIRNLVDQEQDKRAQEASCEELEAKGLMEKFRLHEYFAREESEKKKIEQEKKALFISKIKTLSLIGLSVAAAGGAVYFAWKKYLLYKENTKGKENKKVKNETGVEDKKPVSKLGKKGYCSLEELSK